MTDRSRFGSWGVELSDDDLARAVAGFLQQDTTPGEPVVVRSWTTPAGDAARWLPPLQGTRFQLDASLLDLAELLSRPAAFAASVFLERELEETSVVWTYPLRIGILPGYREAEAREIAAVGWDEVYDLVELSPTASDCDILLLPANFRGGLAAVLDRRLSIHADCVLVLGKLEERGARALRLVDVLRDVTDAAGVAVANQPHGQWQDWFRSMVRALTHDQPLDVALFAQNSGSTPPPFFVASPKLVQASSITRHIAKMAEAIESVDAVEIVVDAAAEPASRSGDPRLRSFGLGKPVVPADVAAGLRAQLGGIFNSELGPASDLGRLTRSLPPGLRNAAATAAPRHPDDRRVVAPTFDERGAVVHRLRRAATYRTSIRIGFPRDGETAATADFPHHLLEPSPTGHRLTIVFAELPQDENTAFAQPQTQELLLPPRDESEPVDFWFHTGGESDRFEARIIVLHQNRVLQTLRYSARLGGEAIGVEPELDVYRLDNLEGRTRFDAALVVNKAGSRMGLCLVVDGRAEYVAPAGLEKQVDDISLVLDKATKLLHLPKTLGDAKLMDVMLPLSYEGNALWTTLGLDKVAKFQDARRIQVVAAKPGEYLPVEFLYGRPVPLKLALCNHAAAALQGAQNGKCTTVKPADELCPVQFWGLNRVIEHVVYADAKERKATKSVQVRPLFHGALVGISERVPKKDALKLMKALNAATGNRAFRATSWADWEQQIAKEKPTLLVLLTHTAKHPLTGKEGLELSGDILPTVALEEVHVRAAGSKEQPVVLLLGCDVAHAPVNYQNAVERLKLKQAGLILGTISSVLGPHAVSFAVALVESLAAAAGTASKFGDVLLDVKRKRLSSGDPFALTLVAYGDSEIRI